jgi:hypothetical protein
MHWNTRTLCSYVVKLNKWKHLLFMTFLKSPNLLTHYNGYGVSFLVVKWPGHGIKHPPHSSTKVKLKTEQSYTSTFLWAFMACSRVNFTSWWKSMLSQLNAHMHQCSNMTVKDNHNWPSSNSIQFPCFIQHTYFCSFTCIGVGSSTPRHVYKQFRTQCYAFMANKCSHINLPLCLKPWV